MSTHNRQKKIAVINDMTGFGKCSLAVSIPIISKLKVQCCWVPTAILSNHTAYPSCFLDDYTKHFSAYTSEWKKLGLKFEGILTGFLGSAEQVHLVTGFIRDFSRVDTVVVVDPVMGDYGQRYSSYTDEMCEEMKNLVRCADIITPNLTEACILTDTPWHEGHWKNAQLLELIRKLSGMGPEKIVITGIAQGEFLANLSFVKGEGVKITRQHKAGEQRYGTGDVFSSIIAADAVNKVPFERSVRRASGFIKKCVIKSAELGMPPEDGVDFEDCLDALR